MRAKLLKNGLMLFAVPLISLLLQTYFRGYPVYQLTAALISTAAIVLILIVSRRKMRRIICPDPEVLDEIGVERIPIAYEPDKFRIDHAVSAVCLWSTALSPLLFFFAGRFPEEVSTVATKFEAKTVPNFGLIAASLCCILFGVMFFGLWVKIGQVRYAVSAGAEKKRYLYRGFAEAADDNKMLYRYLMGVRKKELAAKKNRRRKSE